MAVLCAIAGALLASRLVDGGDWRGRWLWAAALGPAVGLGLAANLSFFRLQAGEAPLSALGFLLVVLALAFLLSLRRVRRSRARPAVSPPWLRTCAAALLTISAAAGARSYLHMSHAYPNGSWDAVAIWDTRASFFYRAPQEFPELIGRLEPTSHPQYPPLLPAALAGEYAIAAQESPAISGATGAAFSAGLVLLMLAAAGTCAELWVGALGASLLLTLPIAMIWAPSHCADVPAAYLLLATNAGLACLGRQGRSRPAPILVGFCLGLLAWIKDEGVMLAGFSLSIWAVLRWSERRRGQRHPRQWPWIFVGAAPGILALILFKVGWPAVKPASFLHGQAIESLISAARWKIPVRAMFAHLIVPGNLWPLAWWPVWLPVAVATLSPRARRARGPWLLVAAPLAALGVFLAVYVMSPYDQAWHINASLDRLLLQLFPSALVGGLILLHHALRRLSRARASAAGGPVRAAAG